MKKGFKIISSQKGSALVYILIAIALLAALTITFMEPSSQQTTSQNTFKTVNTLSRQADFIQSTIQECVLSYPSGDPNIDTSISGTDPDARSNYPINPDSTFYSGSTDGQSGDRLVRSLRCPGDLTGPAANDHNRVFGGGGGKFLPPPPDLFEEWQYYNGADGIFYWTETTKSDSFLNTALEKADDGFSECQADIIDATGGAVNLDSSGPPADTTCSAGSVCLRIWMITNGTAVYPDSPENTACP